MILPIMVDDISNQISITLKSILDLLEFIGIGADILINNHNHHHKSYVSKT